MSSKTSDYPTPPADKKVTTKVYSRTLPAGFSLEESYDEWLKFTWIGGGNLSLAKAPIVREPGDAVTGLGLVREIPPIGIQEKIVGAERPKEVYYTVTNPSALTFQCIYHLGKVEWKQEEGEEKGEIKVEWTISVVPWFGFGWWVALMGYIVINSLLDNYLKHVKNLKK